MHGMCTNMLPQKWKIVLGGGGGGGWGGGVDHERLQYSLSWTDEPIVMPIFTNITFVLKCETRLIESNWLSERHFYCSIFWKVKRERVNMKHVSFCRPVQTRKSWIFRCWRSRRSSTGMPTPSQKCSKRWSRRSATPTASWSSRQNTTTVFLLHSPIWWTISALAATRTSRVLSAVTRWASSVACVRQCTCDACSASLAAWVCRTSLAFPRRTRRSRRTANRWTTTWSPAQRSCLLSWTGMPMPCATIATRPESQSRQHHHTDNSTSTLMNQKYNPKSCVLCHFISLTFNLCLPLFFFFSIQLRKTPVSFKI